MLGHRYNHKRNNIPGEFHGNVWKCAAPRVPSRNAVARTNLGSAYFERGDEDAALHWFRYAYRGWADAPEVVVLLEESEMEAYPCTPKSSKSLLLINGKKQWFGFLYFRKPQIQGLDANDAE